MDFFLEFLLALVELFLEVSMELAGEAVMDLMARAILEVFDVSEFRSAKLASVGYLLLGFLAGGISVQIFPHPLVRRTRLHGISLLISPLITGWAMSTLGSMLRRWEKPVVQIESFWYGFMFAFAMALMRLWFAK